MKNRFDKRLGGFALCLIISGAAYSTHGASPPAHSRLLGFTFFGNQIIEVDPDTGSSHAVATVNVAISGFGLASRYGKLYSFNAQSDQIVEIDPSTGNTRFIDAGLPDLEGEGDIAFSSDGVAYLSAAFDGGFIPAKLFAVDVIAGTSSMVSDSPFPFDGFAFDHQDTLYAVMQGQGKLYRIDRANGARVEVGALGVPMNSPFAGLSFAADGRLLGAIDDRLYQINTNTGAATPVNADVLDLGYSSVSGLALAAVEDPATQLVGLGLYSGQLVQIDKATGAGALIGANPSKVSGIGLASRAGRLYTFEAATRRLVEIDPGSGASVRTNTLTISNVQGEGDIAFSPLGIGYLATALDDNFAPAPRLFTFDILTGLAVPLGSTETAIDGLAFNDAGTLFAIGQAGSVLYRVNILTGALTTVGSLGVEVNSPIAALAFVRGHGLVAALNDRLYAINENTGAATALNPDVLDIGFSSIAGLAETPLRKLMITAEDTRTVLSWSSPDSVLETSRDVTGPYAIAPSQANPQVIGTTDDHRFYRLRTP